MTKTRLLGALLATLALAACGEKNQVQDIAGAPPGAYVKFFNFGINAPQVNFYAGAQKMTAISSTTGVEATTGVAYGSVGSGGFYGAIEPGTYDITGRIAAAVDKDLAIATVNTALADGHAYSFYLTGFYNTTTKQSDAFVIEDVLPPAIDFSTAYVRFVHASPNANPLQLIARAVAPATIVDSIGGVIAFKNAGAFEAVVPGTYNLALRYAAATTDAVTRTNVGFVAGRVYTITLRGDITVTSGTATNRPFLDNTANR
ncbi:MAG: DUF4397 domain-containing protein [Gemmatimonadaceae bacterium]|nr:DUF4397 domain-containing protein [Gemmatimonadaceae bacterium]